MASRSKDRPAMISALVSLLFVAAVCLALGTIASTWRAYGAEVMSLRQQLAGCDGLRELRFVKITTLVRVEVPEVWCPGFRPLGAQMSARRSQSGLNRRQELRRAAA
jgi:hypothetical protein